MTIICEKIWCYMFAEIAKNIGANANIKKKKIIHMKMYEWWKLYNLLKEEEINRLFHTHNSHLSPKTFYWLLKYEFRHLCKKNGSSSLTALS